MADNRAEILDNVEARLATIKPANGYVSDVKVVAREQLSYDKVAKTDMPWLAVFPVRAQPAPEYEAFGSVRELLRYHILGHVTGATQQIRGRALADLARDVARLMQVDPTRGGWAVDTIQAQLAESDEGVPDAGGTTGATATMVTVWESRYYPAD